MSANANHSSIDQSSELPPCPHGEKCYRKNLKHLKKYNHLKSNQFVNEKSTNNSSNNSIENKNENESENESENEINDPNELAEKLIPYYKIIQTNNFARQKTENKMITIQDLVKGLVNRDNMQMIVTGSKMENKVLLTKGNIIYKNEILCKFGYMKIHFKRDMVAQGQPSDYIIAIIDGYRGHENLPMIIWNTRQCLADFNKYPSSKLLYQIVMKKL